LGKGKTTDYGVSKNGSDDHTESDGWLQVTYQYGVTLTVPVLNSVFAPGVNPLDRTVFAGNLASPALEAPGKFHGNFIGFCVVSIQMTGANS